MYYPDLGIDIPDSVLGLHPSTDPAQNTQNGIDYENSQFNLNRNVFADSLNQLGITGTQQQQLLQQWDSAPNHDAAISMANPYVIKAGANRGVEVQPGNWTQTAPGFADSMKDTSLLPGVLTFAAIMAGMGSLAEGLAAGSTLGAGSSIGAATPSTFAVPDLLAASQAPGSSLMTALGTAGAGAGAGTLGGIAAGSQSYLAPTAVDAFSASAPIADEVVVGSGGAGGSALNPLTIGGTAGLAGAALNGLSSSIGESTPTAQVNTNNPGVTPETTAALSGAGGGLMSGIGDSISNFLTGPQLIPSLLSSAGSLIGSSAAKDAAQTQANAAKDATNAQLSMFNTINDQQAPYRQAGYSSLSDLMARLGLKPTGAATDGSLMHTFGPEDLKTNLAPNYQFQLDQGLGATKNAANLQTGLLSGNTLRGVNDYAQNFAGGAYQNAFNNYNANQTNIYNRLSTIAGLGQLAGQTSATAAPSFSNGISNTITGAGAAQAAGQVGSANALSSGLNNVASWYSLPQIMAANAARGA